MNSKMIKTLVILFVVMFVIFGIYLLFNYHRDTNAGFSSSTNYSTTQTTTTTTKRTDNGLGNPNLIQEFGENYTSIAIVSIVLVLIFIFFFYFLGRKKEW